MDLRIYVRHVMGSFSPNPWINYQVDFSISLFPKDISNLFYLSLNA